MLTKQEINKVYQENYIPNMGSVSQGDALFLCQMLDLSRPTKCFEVGVASGMSTTFLLKSLEQISANSELISVDVEEQYYADKTKPTGYVLKNTVPNPQCKFQLLTKNWSADAEQLSADGKFDFVFIDALHVHPWPTIDTMMVLPFVKPETWIAHHDIALSAIAQFSNMTGPVNLFNAFPEPKRASELEIKNIGAFQVSGNHRDYEDVIRKSLEKEWTSSSIGDRFLPRILDVVERFYSDDFAGYVRQKIESHNQGCLDKQSAA